MKRLVFAAIVTLLPLEGVARLWVHFDPTSDARQQIMTWDADQEILFRPAPGLPSHQLNSLGLRGPEVDPAAPHRLLLVGDSVAFGLGLQDRDGMDTRLREALGTEWSVMNAAVPAFSTWQERRYLERYGDILAPTEVVVVYCTNDKWNNADGVSWSAYYRRQEPILDAVERSPIGILSAARYIAALRTAGAIQRDVEAHPPPPAWRGSWAGAWSGLMTQAARGGRPALAVLVPTELQLDQLDLDQTDVEAPLLARAAGVVVVDLLERFRVEPRKSLFLPDDPVHLSARGHQVVADEVLRAFSWFG